MLKGAIRDRALTRTHTTTVMTMNSSQSFPI